MFLLHSYFITSFLKGTCTLFNRECSVNVYLKFLHPPQNVFVEIESPQAMDQEVRTLGANYVRREESS